MSVGNPESGCVRCVFFALEIVERATAEVLFQAIDKHFQLPLTLSYSNLVGLGTDGANVMLGRRNLVFSRLQTEQPSLIAIHCNCHIAALITNASCKVLPDNLGGAYNRCFFIISRRVPREYESLSSFRHLLKQNHISLLKLARLGG